MASSDAMVKKAEPDDFVLDGLPCGADGELFQQRPYVQPYNADVLEDIIK